MTTTNDALFFELENKLATQTPLNVVHGGGDENTCRRSWNNRMRDPYRISTIVL